MQEYFYEESAKVNKKKIESSKYNLFNVFSKLTYIIAIFWFFIGFYLFPATSLIMVLLTLVVPVTVFVLIGVFFARLKNKFCVDYDYTFVSGSIRISKVIKEIKRVSLVKFDCADIEKVGKVGSDLFNSYINQKYNGLKFIDATANDTLSDDKNFYYIVYNLSGQKYLIKIECSTNFLRAIIKFSNRSVFDEELFK